jgi:glycosyltransferase involved in cell wall biosynthesis
MSTQIVNEIIGKKSGAIYAYTNNLIDLINSRIFNVNMLLWYKDIFYKADIYHYQYSNSTRSILLRLLVTNKNKNIITIHDVLPRNPIIKNFISPIIYRIIDIKSRIIIVHSKFAKTLLHKTYTFINPSKVYVIPHIIPAWCQVLKSSSTIENKLRKEFGISKKLIVLLSVGFIKKSKGIIEAIKAVNEINYKNIRLFVIGKITDIECYKILTNVNNKKVKYLGILNDQQLTRWFQIADALVNFRMNSVGETSGSLMQMLGIGKPILSTDIGSDKEILGSAGLYCKANTNDIKKLILKFSCNNNLRKKIREKVKRRSNKYNADVIAKKYLDIFKILNK